MVSRKPRLAILFSVLLLLPLGAISQPTNQIDTLGKITRSAQSVEGDYWIQLAALKNATAIKKLIAKNKQLDYKIHTDKKGLLRLLAGPYRSFAEANSMRQKLNKREAFIRFTKGTIVAGNSTAGNAPPKATVKTEQSPKFRSQFIKASKQKCVEVFEQPTKNQAGSSNKQDCICCIHIKGNNLIKH